MGFFKRMGRLIKSNINAVLDAAEDPEKSLNQLILEMEQNYREAKNQVASAMVDEKKMQRSFSKSQIETKKWMDKAQLAVRKGDDDLAKAALGKSKTSKQLVGEYAKQVEQQTRAVSNLKLALGGLEKKIAEAKRKRQVLLAKKRTVEATKTIHKTVDSIKVDTDAFNEFERLAAKIEDMEDRAHVMLEMSEENLEDKFMKLEVEDELDDELETLKLEMGLVSDTTKQLEDKSVKSEGAQEDLSADEADALASKLDAMDDDEEDGAS